MDLLNWLKFTYLKDCINLFNKNIGFMLCVNLFNKNIGFMLCVSIERNGKY